MAASIWCHYYVYSSEILIFFHLQMIAFLLFLSCVSYPCFSSILTSDESDLMNEVFPPIGHKHGPHRSHRHVRECQPAKYNNVTHESYPSHSSIDRNSETMELRSFSKEFEEFGASRTALGHQVIINDPALTLSVLEPQMIGGCSAKTRETVAISADQRHCLFAANAGFFNVTDGSCLGNVVSDGREASNSGGIQNAHFGIKRDGSLFVGYIPEDGKLNETFEQLVGGVIWLVRNGENYIETSKVAECPDSQTTGSLQGFIDVQSARTAIGHDTIGRVHIVQVDGKTFRRGISLNAFADLLVTLGLVNAVNLDGGGSATAVLNGSVINYPSDTGVLNNFTYNVARKVSTILCVADRRCVPECGLHGRCVRGICECGANWHGAKCDDLLCSGDNCSGNGACTPDGCRCHTGFDGPSCSLACPKGKYGFGCQSLCNCPGNSSTVCDHITGQCPCSAGHTGRTCESICPLGRFGEECAGVCRCAGGCFCDPTDGSCNPQMPSAFFKAGSCYGNLTVIVQRGAYVISSTELRSWMYVVIAVAVVLLLSLVLNFVFLCRTCKRGVRRKSRRRQHRSLPRVPTSNSEDDDGSSDWKAEAETPLMNLDGNSMSRSPRRP